MVGVEEGKVNRERGGEYLGIGKVYLEVWGREGEEEKEWWEVGKEVKRV